MTRIIIDGRKAQVAEGTTVMAAADGLGIRIPRLCHHPALSSSGSCGVCLVRIAGRDGFQRACEEIVSDGMEVIASDDSVRRARADAIELLLVRHPNDCPSCHRAGECELGDIYFEHSQRSARDDISAREVEPLRVGPRLIKRTERCIGCLRCERFASEVAGAEGPALFEHAYSICAAELCPSGALEPLGIGSTPPAWRMSSSPSICIGCARGCDVWIDHRDGQAVRFRPRGVDGAQFAWMCDDGRGSLPGRGGENRTLAPLILEDFEMRPATWSEAETRAATLLRGFDPELLAVVLSARASVEENLAFLKLARTALGASKVFVSGRESDPGFADGFLRVADLNPNARGVSSMAASGLSDLPRGAGLIVLDGLGSADLIAAVESRPAWVILATHDPIGMQRWADVVLPKASHCEQEGTFVTEGGAVKVVGAALTPAGDSMPAWGIAGAIARAAGRAFDAEGAQAMRSWAAKEGIVWNRTR